MSSRITGWVIGATFWVVGLYLWTLEKWYVVLPFVVGVNTVLYLGSHYGPLPLWLLVFSLVVWPGVPLAVAFVIVLVLSIAFLRFGSEPQSAEI